jgi:hypothetical protein
MRQAGGAAPQTATIARMYPSDDSVLRVRLLTAQCRAARERLQQRLQADSAVRDGTVEQEPRAGSPPALTWIMKIPGQDER